MLSAERSRCHVTLAPVAPHLPHAHHRVCLSAAAAGREAEECTGAASRCLAASPELEPRPAAARADGLRACASQAEIAKRDETINELQGKADKANAEASTLRKKLADANVQVKQLKASQASGDEEKVTCRAGQGRARRRGGGAA